MKKTQLILVSMLLLTLSACKRENPFGTEEEKTTTQNIEAKNLISPAGFNFETEKELTVRVKVADATPNTKYGIKIYANLPSTGKIISTGQTNANGEYTNILRVPAALEFIYIEKINPDGSKNFEKVAANQFASALFKNGNTPPAYTIRKASGMDCGTGCTVTFNNPTSNIVINANETACITGVIGSNVSVTMGDNSKAKICATGTFKNFKPGVSSELYFLEASAIRINKFNPPVYYRTKNWSDSLVIDSSSGYRFNTAVFYNYGTCYIPSLNSAYNFYNHGKLTVEGTMDIAGYMYFYNYNYLRVKGNINLDVEGFLSNDCHIQVDGNLLQRSNFGNHGFAKILGTYSMYTTGPEFLPSTALYPGSLISTTDFSLSAGFISGVDGFIKVVGNTSLTGGAMTSGTLCDVNGIETNTGGAYLVGANLSCSGYIATSACNPEGYGSSTVADADSDGILDAYDEYPNDATRAFNTYYPAANSVATIAFEDLWPTLGDYDFNDLAVNFNIQQVQDPNGQVIEYKVKVKVKAVGGSFENGLGFQLDELVPADISTVTGQSLVKNLISRNANNTEAGQNKAVIICFDSPEPVITRVGGSMFNTIKTNGMGTSDTMYINITFANPIAPTKLTIAKFNPFIFTKQRRGYEIHLPNFIPTTLANTSLFGTFADRSNISNGTYYKNANGLPWAMLIPEDFYYAKEKSPITSAYNFFDDWVLSGGSNYTNWFGNIGGNKNTDNIY